MQKKLLTLISILLLLGIIIWALLSVNGRSVDPSNPDKPITNKGAIRILNKELEKLDYKLYINEQEERLVENSLRGLDPGKYNIKLIAGEYNNWEANVTVIAGQITEITPYLFSKNSNLVLKTKTPINIDKIFFSEHTDYAYFVVNNTSLGSEKGVWKISLDESSTVFSTNNSSSLKIFNIDTTLQEIINTGQYKIISSPNDSKILIYSDKDKLVINTDPLTSQPNKQSESLTEILGFNPQEVFWFNQGNALIIKDNNLLGHLNLSNNTLEVITYSPNSAPIFSVNGNIVYYVDPNTKKLMIFKDNNKSELVLENQKLPTDISYIQVAASNSNYLIYRSQNKYFYTDIETSFIGLIGEDINTIDFSSDGKSLLFEKNFTLFSYFLDEINPLNEYSPQTTEIISNYNPATHFVKYNGKSSHILLLNNMSDGQISITAMEKNGKNRYELYKGNNLVSNYFYMLRNNKELILLLRTDTIVVNQSEPNNIQKNHLYSRDLEV